MSIKRTTILKDLAIYQSSDMSSKDMIQKLFAYQRDNNLIFRTYLKLTKRKHKEIQFLPIEFFKNQKIQTGQWDEQTVFLSSGTTGVQSKHYVRSVPFYLDNAVTLFERRFGAVSNCAFLCLLPSYLERKGSSLIAMCQHFISMSNHIESDFYLDNHDELYKVLELLYRKGTPTVLFGVSFALLDLDDRFREVLSSTIIIETGGMKGRRKEMTKDEVFQRLKQKLSPQGLYSEYGMTELLSQAYSDEHGVFRENNMMKVRITELNDPFTESKIGKIGQINIIDLANIDTCAFIQTADLGRRLSDSTFTVEGRLHNSDLRGCNLLLEEL